MAPGLVGPKSYAFRDPRARSLVNGRVLNRPRFIEVGGAHTQAVWFREAGNHQYAQAKQKNQAALAKPTNVKSAHKSSREND